MSPEEAQRVLGLSLNRRQVSEFWIYRFPSKNCLGQLFPKSGVIYENEFVQSLFDIVVFFIFMFYNVFHSEPDLSDDCCRVESSSDGIDWYHTRDYDISL